MEQRNTRPAALPVAQCLVLSTGLLLLSSAASTAQPVPPAQPSDHGETALPAVPNCLHFYPVAAVQNGEQGDSVVLAHILSNGTVASAKVANSSGHKDLDEAAVACLTGSHVKPLTQKSAPIEADIEMGVNWRISADTSVAPNTSPDVGPYYPPLAQRLNHEGNVILSFTVATDGSVKDITVSHSSGHPELDNATIAYVSKLHYPPASRNGLPIEYDRQFQIEWRRR